MHCFEVILTFQIPSTQFIHMIPNTAGEELLWTENIIMGNENNSFCLKSTPERVVTLTDDP